MSTQEKKILSKGFSFIPTPNPDEFSTHVDIFKFVRQLKLKYHFKDSPDTTATMGEDPGFKLRSDFIPAVCHPLIDTFHKLVLHDIRRLDFSNSTNRSNLSAVERRTLNNLLKDPTIIIKPADKGGGLVVMNKEDYIMEVKRQLNDQECYKILDQDPTFTFKKQVENILQMATNNEWINEATRKYLLMDHPMVPVFYTLPKVHKTLQNPPGRPIVASTNSIFQPLATYLDHYLQPLAKDCSSYIKDTTDFLNKIEAIGTLSEDTRLASFDVNSLYTSIPHEEGMQAVQDKLTQTDLITSTQTFLLELLRMILYKNYFRFQDTFYLQLKGTAMGSNVAPCYANIFMSNFEEEHIIHHPQWHHFIRVWMRYIDDIFVIWHGDRESLDTFFAFLNQIHHSIKFSMEGGENTVHFLDTLITLEAGQLSVDLYVKPTDRNSFLQAQSYHPKSMIRNLPYSQFLRIRRIVSEPQQSDNRVEEMKLKFKKRGYKDKWLDLADQKSRLLTRRELLVKDTSRDRTHDVVFTTTYSPISKKVKNIIMKHWHIFEADVSMKSLFSQPPLFSYSRASNLRDRMVKADIGIKQRMQTFLGTPAKGCFPCLGCPHCNNLIKGNVINHPHSGKQFFITEYLTCMSSWVVYLIKCPCGLLYIGETSREIKIRIGEHKSAIRTNNKKSSVARHFASAQHTIAQLKFQVIEQIQRHQRGGDRSRKLKQREAFWIHTFNTVSPLGMNESLDLSCFLRQR